MKYVLPFLFLPVLALAQTVPTVPQTGQNCGLTGLVCSPATSRSDLAELFGTKADATAPTLKTEDGHMSVRVSLAAPISKARTWMGSTSYPVPGLTEIPDGHLAIQGQTRGWGAGASILEVFANDPDGATFCEGAMNCYVQPNSRSYAGQDGVAATFFAYSRPTLGQGLSIASVAAVTMANGAPAVRITLSTALTAAQAAAVTPLMKVETATGYFGYTVATGLAYPPVTSDGLILTVDGMFNTAGQAMPAPPAGTALSLDVLHQVDGLYIGARTGDGDVITDMHAIEGVVINDRSTPTVFSSYDPINDKPDINGVYMPIYADIAGGVGVGGSAFMAADTLESAQPGSWHRGLACRNRPTSNTGATDCVTNVFATNGLHSIANTTNGTLINNALLVQPNDKNGSTTALITQAGDALFHSVTTAGPVQLTGASTVTNLNANATSFTVATLPGGSSCTPGNTLFISNGRNPVIDVSSNPGSGVLAFCNSLHYWISTVDGKPVVQ